MINDKTVLMVTLARGGSQGIHKKNIVPIHGKPLLQYTTEAVKQSKYADRYIVSSDDDEILNVCKQLNVESIHRPDELATSSATSSAAVIHIVNQLTEKYYYVVDVPCTNPLKTIEDIDGCVEKLDSTGADSVVAVVRAWDKHPSRAKYIENDHLIDFYPETPETMRQDLTPICYFRNGSVYATTCKSLLGTGIRLGGDSRPYIMPEARTMNVDEPIDLELARVLLKNE